MGLAVDGHCRFLVRRLDQAIHASGGLVEPVLDVPHAVLVLHFQVTLMRPGDRFLGASDLSPLILLLPLAIFFLAVRLASG
jgi:hypothetical protein